MASRYLNSLKLWDINNDIAQSTAELFYNNIFNGTILEALQGALVPTIGNRNENIYIYWGLHFSSLKSRELYETSKQNVFNMLLRSFWGFRKRAENENNYDVKRRVYNISRWLSGELFEGFLKNM